VRVETINLVDRTRHDRDAFPWPVVRLAVIVCSFRILQTPGTPLNVRSA
jgi:hypothetical protein